METEKHPLQQLWELRQYLNKMRDLQTVLVKFDGLLGPECVAFEFTEGYQLGSEFKQLGYKPSFALAMADAGLNPMKYGTVYAYIERRAPGFVSDYFGWGIDR